MPFIIMDEFTSLSSIVCSFVTSQLIEVVFTDMIFKQQETLPSTELELGKGGVYRGLWCPQAWPLGGLSPVESLEGHSAPTAGRRIWLELS